MFAGLGSVLDLIRLSLPSVIATPLVDLVLILNAIMAALWSGFASIAWPSAALAMGFVVQLAFRRLRRQ